MSELRGGDVETDRGEGDDEKYGDWYKPTKGQAITNETMRSGQRRLIWRTYACMRLTAGCMAWTIWS